MNQNELDHFIECDKIVNGRHSEQELLYSFKIFMHVKKVYQQQEKILMYVLCNCNIIYKFFTLFATFVHILVCTATKTSTT